MYREGAAGLGTVYEDGKQEEVAGADTRRIVFRASSVENDARTEVLDAY